MSVEGPALLAFSDQTAARLRGLVADLEQWNPRISLVSKSTLASAWDRHILDSAQLLPLAPAGARVWADLGSGGGFPGLVVAIIAAESHPDLTVTLIESDQRKAAFLREAARRAGIAVRVIAERIEAVPSVSADVVSARALAPLDRLWPLADRHLTPGGTALFLKGAGAAGEREGLDESALSVETLPSATDAGAVVMRIQRARDE